MAHACSLFLALVLAVVLAPVAGAEERVVLDSPAAVKKALRHRDAAVRLAAARAAAGFQDHLLTTPLIKLLEDKELPVREAAVEALAGREAKRDRKSAAVGLAARIAPLEKDESSKAELLLVVQALHDLAEESTIKALLDVDVNDDREIVKARALAVANVPSAEAIERLLQLGSQGRRRTGWVAIARDALRYATGAQVKGGADAWRQWWRDAEADFSFEAAAKRRADKREAKRRKAERTEEARRKQEEKRRQREERKRRREEEQDEGED